MSRAHTKSHVWRLPFGYSSWLTRKRYTSRYAQGSPGCSGGPARVARGGKSLIGQERNPGDDYMAEPTEPHTRSDRRERSRGEKLSALSIEETAARFGRYRWVEMRLFEVLGGWVPTVPELDVKVRLGTHSRHHAWHAEVWSQLLPTIPETDRDPPAVPAGDGLVSFFEKLAEAEGAELTIEKLVGVYRVLIPHKIASYTRHLDMASPVADAPAIRWLELVLHDELGDWREGEMMIQGLLRTPEVVDRAAAWQATTERLLVDAGP